MSKTQHKPGGLPYYVGVDGRYRRKARQKIYELRAPTEAVAIERALWMAGIEGMTSVSLAFVGDARPIGEKLAAIGAAAPPGTWDNFPEVWRHARRY